MPLLESCDRIPMKAFLLSFSLLAAIPVAVFAQPRPERPTAKMVLVAFTGPEDGAKLGAPYRHALLMKRSGKLADVAIVVNGRAVAALSKRVEGIPPAVRKSIAEAHAAGIPIYVCEHSLKMAGIAPDDVTPEAQRVPTGAEKIAELVASGYVPMQY